MQAHGQLPRRECFQMTGDAGAGNGSRCLPPGDKLPHLTGAKSQAAQGTGLTPSQRLGRLLARFLCVCFLLKGFTVGVSVITTTRQRRGLTWEGPGEWLTTSVGAWFLLTLSCCWWRRVRPATRSLGTRSVSWTGATGPVRELSRKACEFLTPSSHGPRARTHTHSTVTCTKVL